MHRLNDTALTPSCGWIYTVPETKTDIQAMTFLTLLDKVMENYEINGIERNRDEVDAEIQDFICRKIPTGLCGKFVNHFVSTPKELIEKLQGLSSIMSGYVSEEEACARAGVCRNCEFNTAIEGGINHNGIPYMIKRLKGKRKTNLDDELHMCAICKCFLTLLVHVKAEALEKHIKSVKLYPEECWKRIEIENIRRNQ